MSVVTVILAAGEGTRMQSQKPKVLHEIACLPMLGHVMLAAGEGDIAVVIGPNREDVGQAALDINAHVKLFTQVERKGTAHALLHAKQAFANNQDVIMLFGDVPLITSETVRKLKESLKHAAITVLGFETHNPQGYGRLKIEGGELFAIIEQKECSESEKLIKTVNGGPMALRGDVALKILEAIDNNNATGEFYVTDAVKIARQMGLKTSALIVSEQELYGVNDRVQLATAEEVLQNRLREKAMRGGATLQAPQTVFFAYDTKIGKDVIIEPNVVFVKGVTIHDNVVIHAFSHLEGAVLEGGVSIGPYARLRKGTHLAKGAKIGNFVETKAAKIGEGAKVNHLSYIGDAEVGAGANIGAGVITCNYDGFLKYKTTIGKGAFIGSNSSLVAPVTIADGGYVGSGSVITMNIPQDALGVARGKQRNLEGWAANFRTKKKAEKAK